MKKTIAEMSIDTRIITERLEKACIGDTVTYAELSSLIGRDIMDVYHLTRTARKHLLHMKMYFEPVPGVGFKRCNDSEKVASGGSYIQKSRRACKRGVSITSSIDDYDTMSNEDKVRHNAQLSLMLTIRSISTTSKRKAIESRVSESQESLSMRRTLEAVAGSMRTPKAQKTNGEIEEQKPMETE